MGGAWRGEVLGEGLCDAIDDLGVGQREGV